MGMRTKKEIVERNDKFRKAFFQDKNHKIVLTQGVLEDPNQEAVVDLVKNFDSFTEDNDPHGEHDFGRVEVNREKYFFKIDYYDLNYDYGADPLEDEYNCVLTIMRADEY